MSARQISVLAHTSEISEQQQALLAANGNRWRVKCWQDGNHKRYLGAVFVRAQSATQAKRIAKAVKSQARFCVATVWDPRNDLSVQKFVVLNEGE
jgi:hypothetical protein